MDAHGGIVSPLLVEEEHPPPRRRGLSEGARRALYVCPPLLCAAVGLACLTSSRGRAAPAPARPKHNRTYVPPLPDFSVPNFVYRPKYACAICLDIINAQPSLAAGERACAVFGACDAINQSTSSCDAHCADAAIAEAARMPRPADIAHTLNLRVSKGLGSKPYELVRLSVVTSPGEATPLLGGAPFDYSAPFRYRWTQHSLHSSLVRVVPGAAPTIFDVAGTPVRLSLPRVGAGVSGVLIADPCVAYSSITALVACTYGVRYALARRLPELLDAFVGSNASDVSYWGILGDNLYDRTGEVSRSFFDSLALGTKSKIVRARRAVRRTPGRRDWPARRSAAALCAQTARLTLTDNARATPRHAAPRRALRHEAAYCAGQSRLLCARHAARRHALGPVWQRLHAMVRAGLGGGEHAHAGRHGRSL